MALLQPYKWNPLISGPLITTGVMVVSIEGFFWHSFQESFCITGPLMTAKYEEVYFLGGDFEGFPLNSALLYCLGW